MAHADRGDDDDFASTQAPAAAEPRAADECAWLQHAGRWVESSWDLQRGLSVREGLPADAALDEWIAALLRG